MFQATFPASPLPWSPPQCPCTLQDWDSLGQSQLSSWTPGLPSAFFLSASLSCALPLFPPVCCLATSQDLKALSHPLLCPQKQEAGKGGPSAVEGSPEQMAAQRRQEGSQVSFGSASQGLCVDASINNLSVPQLPPLP